MALPHLRVEGIETQQLVLVRVRSGVVINAGTVMSQGASQTVQALFFLLSPSSKPAEHLRLLSELAACVEQDRFIDDWISARDEEGLRERLLRDERYFTLVLTPGYPSAELIDQKIRSLGFPAGCLVAIIRRGSSALIPRADMVLKQGDRLTVIGESEGIKALKERFKLPL